MANGKDVETQEEKDDAARKAARAEAEKKADATNAERKGKGTRIAVGSTRGKGSQVITWEAFDRSKPETLPIDLEEFITLSKTDKTNPEPALVNYLIEGYNSLAETAASDPVAEFVDQSWPDEIQTRFKVTVKGYAGMTGVSIEDAVTLMRPGIVAKVAADKLAAEKELVTK